MVQPREEMFHVFVSSNTGAVPEHWVDALRTGINAAVLASPATAALNDLVSSRGISFLAICVCLDSPAEWEGPGVMRLRTVRSKGDIDIFFDVSSDMFGPLDVRVSRFETPVFTILEEAHHVIATRS
jgi:hypothetical protein